MMSKWVTGFLMAAPLSLAATPLTLRSSGFYHLKNKGAALSHSWQNSIPIAFDQKTVVDRVKKQSCAGETCQTFELLTELTAHELPDDMMLVEVAFTNTSDGAVTRLTGETKIRKYEDSGKIDLKSETNGSEHFGIHLAPINGN